MYTVNIVSKEILNGNLKIVVVFTDGTDTVTEQYETKTGLHPDWIKNRIKTRLNELNSLLSLYDLIPIGAYTPPEDTPDPAREEFRSKVATHDQMVRAIERGIMTEQDVAFVNIRTWLKANFIQSYSDLL
jgi:hypothetical protein